MTENEVYEFYNDSVKVIYSEIEALNNSLPIELLFEINSAFDHLKRIHVEKSPEEKESEKAYSHLKRGCLDAYKLKLKYFNVNVSKILNEKADLRIIDNGKYLVEFISERNQIYSLAKEARLSEAKKNSEEAFEKWNKVSYSINNFESKFFNPTKINWAKKQSFFRFSGSFIVGILTGIIASFIFAFLTKIIKF